MPDFRQLLSKPLDDVKRTPPLPAGTYHGIIKSWEPGESAQKKTPYVRFNLALTAPGDGIPPEDLVDIQLSTKKLRRDFYITEDAEYRIKEFLESCGISTAGRTYNETLPETINAPVLISVTQRLNQNDPTAPPFNDVSELKGEPA